MYKNIPGSVKGFVDEAKAGRKFKMGSEKEERIDDNIYKAIHYIVEEDVSTNEVKYWVLGNIDSFANYWLNLDSKDVNYSENKDESYSVKSYVDGDPYLEFKMTSDEYKEFKNLDGEKQEEFIKRNGIGNLNIENAIIEISATEIREDGNWLDIDEWFSGW